jgi:hypothetical protein
VQVSRMAQSWQLIERTDFLVAMSCRGGRGDPQAARLSRTQSAEFMHVSARDRVDGCTQASQAAAEIGALNK